MVLITSLLVLLVQLIYAVGNTEAGDTLGTINPPFGFGTVTANTSAQVLDPNYQYILGHEFSGVALMDGFIWSKTEPYQNQFNFSEGDNLVSFASKYLYGVTGNSLVQTSCSELPDWVNAITDKNTLVSVLVNHVTQLVSHFKGKVQTWNVVNEPFLANGSMPSSVFYEVLGLDFITIAVRAARASDPDAILMINNDYLEHPDGLALASMTNLITFLSLSDLAIDAVGIEGHYTVGNIPSTLASVLQTFADLNVPYTYITELDIRMELPSTIASLEQQRADYKNVTATCLQQDCCVSISLWDFADGYSPVPEEYPGEGDACPWDDTLLPKPAYAGISDALYASMNGLKE